MSTLELLFPALNMLLPVSKKGPNPPSGLRQTSRSPLDLFLLPVSPTKSASREDFKPVHFPLLEPPL